MTRDPMLIVDYLVLVQKQLRLFVAILRLISIPKCEVIYEQVLSVTAQEKIPW
jgi:hypothetical protein